MTRSRVLATGQLLLSITNTGQQTTLVILQRDSNTLRAHHTLQQAVSPLKTGHMTVAVSHRRRVTLKIIRVLVSHRSHRAYGRALGKLLPRSSLIEGAALSLSLQAGTTSQTGGTASARIRLNSAHCHGDYAVMLVISKEGFSALIGDLANNTTTLIAVASSTGTIAVHHAHAVAKVIVGIASTPTFRINNGGQTCVLVIDPQVRVGGVFVRNVSDAIRQVAVANTTTVFGVLFGNTAGRVVVIRHLNSAGTSHHAVNQAGSVMFITAGTSVTVHSTQVSTTVKGDVLVTHRLPTRRMNSADKAAFGVLHVDTCTALMHDSANTTLFIAQVCDSSTCPSAHTQVNTGEAENVLGSRVVRDTQQGRGVIVRSVQNIAQGGVSNRTLFTHQLGKGQFFKPPRFTRSTSVTVGAVLTNHSVESNLTTVSHSPDSILNVQLHTALNIRRPASTEHTGYSVLTKNSHTVVHTSYRTSRNHTSKRHIGLFFNEVTGCNVHGVIHITACGGHSYYSRRWNFQIVALSTNTSCADCTFQSRIGNGNNLARATVLLKSIGYDTQPGLIVGVRLIPCFKRADEIFSIDGAPLALNHKLCGKVTQLARLSIKASTKVRQSIRERAHGRRAR